MRSIPLLLIVLVVGVNSDEYLNEMQNRCFATKRTHSCAKWQFFKYIDDYDLGNYSLTSDSSVQLVTIPSANISEVRLFEQSRQYSQQDSEFMKVLKYGKRRVVKFLHEQGFSLELPDEVVVTESRQVTGKGKKQKKMIILPLLILAKVFKIKVLVSLILVGIVAIKKMLLTAAFILPGVVAAIKSHCKAQQFHVVPYNVDEQHHTHSHEHEDHDFGGYEVSGYGYGGDKHYWDKKKRYSLV